MRSGHTSWRCRTWQSLPSSSRRSLAFRGWRPASEADRKTRRQLFDPVKIRIALDTRDADTTKKREAEYDKLSELASHASFRGFRLTTRGEFGELAFVKKINLMAWLEEMVLRLGPAAVMYATQFPDADPPLTRFFQEFSAELIQEAVVGVLSDRS